MTPAQIRFFQSAHRDWSGKPLRVDGDLGPKTMWAMGIAELDPRRQAIVQRACSRVGETEEAGENRGEWEDWLCSWAGIPLGSPGCAAFASWAISVDGLPEVREGSALELGRSLRSTTLVLPGDVMWFPTGKLTGHCGVVIGLGPGEVACVEHNSNDLCRLTRRLTNGVRFSTPLPVQQLPGIPPGLPLVPVAYLGTR